MRTLVALACLGAFLFPGCATPVQEEVGARLGVTKSPWPWGSYHLVSYDGQELPVELPNGQVLSSGECYLGKRQSGDVRFSLRLYYPPYRWWQSRHGFRIEGSVWGPEDARKEAPVSLQFVRANYQGEDWNGGFTDFPLQWGDHWEVEGRLLGNKLTLRKADRILVFMRR